MPRFAAVDAHAYGFPVPPDVQLAGVTGCAGDVEQVVAQLLVVMAGEAHRQLVRVQAGRSPVDQESERAQVVGIGESLPVAGLLQVREPAVAKILDRRALRREV